MPPPPPAISTRESVTRSIRQEEAHCRLMIATSQRLIPLCALAAGVFLGQVELAAQGSGFDMPAGSETESFLPERVTPNHFAPLRQHSPFLRTLDLSQSLIITGVARIDDEPVATLLDLETSKTSVVSRKSVSPEGWQLVEVKGNLSDIETLTARIKIAGGSEIFTVRYEKAPPPANGGTGTAGSGRIGNGSPGGGTGPHGGPDPRVLTPDQLTDARNAARNIREGFKADGYGDNQVIPPEVVSKISRLSVEQREEINVKMYEYRNRGLGMQERQQIYNRMLDQTLQRR